MKDEFSLRFWGVRGTVPTPGAHFVEYGGNTSCVEMQCGDKRLIFDAGTGLRVLGERAPIGDADIFLSHTHLDHIQGFPFFMPFYNPDNQFRIWAGHLFDHEGGVRDVLGRLMYNPLFPISLEFMRSQMQFIDFRAGDDIAPKGYAELGIKVHTFLLNHPDNSTAYRVEYNGKSACYVTDVEHEDETPDPALVKFIQGTDIFIYDSTFSDENFEQFKGWGHSTWQHGLKLAKAANVARFAVFHHDPSMTDAKLHDRELALQKQDKQAFIAKEGQIVRL